jgi:hypothetical protein
MSHCTIEGCPNAAVAKGLCAKHYMRVVRTGDATAKQKPGPKPKPGGKGEAMASLQAEIAALKTRLAAEVERPRAERHRVTKPVTKPGTADAAPLLTRIETLEAELRVSALSTARHAGFIAARSKRMRAS